MAKIALATAFLISVLPGFCLPQREKAPEPVQHFEPISEPVYVEPRSTKGH